MHGGGPFGAVITKDGKLIAEGANKVTINHDPTAHAEVMAIRNACAKLGTHDLTGCELYTSCEPCPMCLSSAYWANLKKIHFGASQDDAARFGFDDAFLYKEVAKEKKDRSIPITEIVLGTKTSPFEAWNAKTDKATYGDNFEP